MYFIRETCDQMHKLPNIAIKQSILIKFTFEKLYMNFWHFCKAISLINVMLMNSFPHISFRFSLDDFLGFLSDFLNTLAPTVEVLFLSLVTSMKRVSVLSIVNLKLSVASHFCSCVVDMDHFIEINVMAIQHFVEPF